MKIYNFFLPEDQEKERKIFEKIVENYFNCKAIKTINFNNYLHHYKVNINIEI